MENPPPPLKWPLAGPKVSAIARWVSSDEGKSNDFTRQRVFPESYQRLWKKLLVRGKKRRFVFSGSCVKSEKWPAGVSPDNSWLRVRKAFESIKEHSWCGMKRVAVKLTSCWSASRGGRGLNINTLSAAVSMIIFTKVFVSSFCLQWHELPKFS